MGEHSKGPAGIGVVLDFVRKHRKAIVGFVAGAVAAVTAIKPDFPGAAVMGAVHVLLGV
jgi:hypothetical protein